MNRKLTYLFGVVFAIPLVGVTLFAEGLRSSDTPAADPVERIAAGPLQCDFEGYEGILNYEEASTDEQDVYALGMGYANRGSRETHTALRAAFADLQFHPTRAPIVSADLETARLHVFDCQTAQCTREEIALDAPLACIEALGTRSCMTFAVRVNGNSYCTLGPGLGQ